MKTKAELQQEIEAIKARLQEIEAEFKQPEKEVSFNEILVKYIKTATNILHFNRCHDEKLKAIRAMLIVSDYVNGDWVPDWKNFRENKYTFKVGNDNIINIDSYKSVKSSFYYFKSEETARRALSILGEETIKIALS